MVLSTVTSEIFATYRNTRVSTDSYCVRDNIIGNFQLVPAHFIVLSANHTNVRYSMQMVSRNVPMDDWKTKWQLHSVDLTSTGLSSPGKNIIHSPVARVVRG